MEKLQDILQGMMDEQRKILDTMDGLTDRSRMEAKEKLILLDYQIKQYEERKKALSENSNLGRRFKTRTFDNFQVEKQPVAYEKAYEYAIGFDKDEKAGLLLMGNPGTGKTHLAAAITNYLIEEKNVPVKFGGFIDILNDIKRSFGTDDDIVARLKGIHLLVIDDLGKERRSEWSESILYEVINGRYEDYMPTIITTNLNNDQLAHRFGEAVLSRILEMCEGVVMVGSDVRREGMRTYE